MARKREVTRLEISTFEMDGAYHATVTNFGEVVHTTEAFTDHDSARWAALDWLNGQAKYRNTENATFAK